MNFIQKTWDKLRGKKPLIDCEIKSNVINEQRLNAIRREFYLQFLGKGDIYFDVGANIGNRIEPILSDGIKIVAVEPQADCIKVLETKYGDKIQLVKKGLASKPGEMTMHIADVNTISTFSEEFINSTGSNRFKDNNWEKKIIVEMTTLDHLIEDFGLPHFIKIDVEGFENEVLKGLSKPVAFLSIEYAVPDCLGLLKDCLTTIETIYRGKALYNYSIGESMIWANKDWLTYKDISQHILTESFISTEFGDLYIKKSN